MNTYECLQDEACGDGIDVIDYTFHSDRIKWIVLRRYCSNQKRYEYSSENLHTA